MRFDLLLDRVKRAEQTLEANERQVSADLRQLKRTWRSAWTPGRIVTIGALSGFMFGRAEPLKHVARSGGAVHLVNLAMRILANHAKAAVSTAAAAAAASPPPAEQPEDTPPDHDASSQDGQP